MLRRLGFTLLLASLALLFATSALAIPIARLQVWSEPGDPIGEGGTFDIIYDPDFGASATSGVWVPSTSYRWEGFDVYLDSAAGSHSRLSLGPSDRGVPLQAGYYPNAQEWGFEEPGHPGLDFSFRSTGAWRPTGEFTIHEITYTPDGGSLSSLVVDFVQRDQGTALRGRLEYDTAGLTIIPEPSAALLMLMGLAGLSGRERRGPHRHRRAFADGRSGQGHLLEQADRDRDERRRGRH